MIAGALEIQLMANIARLQQDMDKAKSVVSTTMGGIDKAVGVAKAALGALGLGLSVNAFANLIKGSINAQDELAKMSQRVGVSVESLNGLGHAAGLSGTSLSTVEKALKTMSGGMLDAQRGLSGAKENFAALGISVTDSTGALRSADSVMVEVADKFAHMKDGTEKAAIATKLFGRAGLELIPMLNEGSEGLAAMVREGQRLNPVTTASAAQAEMFNDNMDRLKTTMDGFVTQIANSALPRLSEWTEAVVKVINVTNEQIEAQDEWLATIGSKSKEEMEQAIQRTHDEIEAKRQQIVVTEALAKSVMGYGDRLRQQQRELADLESAQQVNVAQLKKLREGYVPATAAAEDLTEATEALATVTAEETAEIQAQAKALAEHQKKVRDTINELAAKQAQLHMTGREQAIYTALVDLGSEATSEEQRRVAALTASLYDQEAALKVAGDEWGAMVKELETLGKKQVADAEKVAADVTKAQEAAAQKAADDWREFHSDLSDLILDVWSSEDNPLKAIGNAFEGLLKKMVADLVASGIMRFLTGQGFNLGASPTSGGFANTVVNAATGGGLSAALGIGGGGGVIAAGSQFMGGLTGGAIGTNSMVATGASTFGAGINSALAAVPGWGWALAGGTALAAVLAEDSTPSSNAGFLMKDVPGASPDRKFDVPEFASGFDPVGFARRDSQQNAVQVIDTFRAYDAALTEMARSVGYTVDYDWTKFAGMGSSETGSGSGVFVGSASEDGTLNSSAISSQVDEYVRLWVEGLGSQIGPNAKAQILAAGNADAMVAKAAELVAGVHGSHAAGLDYVPFDGYRAELHQGERVVPAAAARSSDSAMSAMAAKLDAVVTELRSIKYGTDGTYKMLRNMSPDGLSLQTVSA